MRTLLALVLGGSVLVPLHAANEWTTVVEKLEQSIVTVTGKAGGWCSAFVISEADDRVMTAFHCKSELMYVDGIPATLVRQDPKRDVMVLHVPNLDRPALTVAKDDPLVGDRILCAGYGYGWETIMAREAMVGDVNTDVEEKGWPGPLVSVDSAFEGGMSGTGCVNRAGEVVMMVKGSTDRRGVGPGAKILRRSMGRYLPKI
jgi:S1-C subfamily serine protease